jgi:hypothetical protein
MSYLICIECSFQIVWNPACKLFLVVLLHICDFLCDWHISSKPDPNSSLVVVVSMFIQYVHWAANHLRNANYWCTSRKTAADCNCTTDLKAGWYPFYYFHLLLLPTLYFFYLLIEIFDEYFLLISQKCQFSDVFLFGLLVKWVLKSNFQFTSRAWCHRNSNFDFQFAVVAH